MTNDPLAEPAAFGYAVWLMPERGQLPRLLRGAAQWARRVGGLVCEQHLTLRARLSLEDARVAVVRHSLESPLRFTLGPPTRGDAPWRALHRPVCDGRDEAVGLYERVCHAVGVTPAHAYLPHVSMAYASSPRAGDEPTPSEAAPTLEGVTFDRIEVWDLRGAPSAWRPVR